MDKFSEYGIKDFYLSVNHKAKMIKSYFEEEPGKYNLHYIEEKVPLGTAGSLVLIKKYVNRDFIVTNCDIIIDGNYAEIVKCHRMCAFDMTLVVSCKRYVIPYGVCSIQNGGILRSIKEKPEYDLLVNTGMYIINRELLSLIPRNKQFDIPELITKAKAANFKIGVFPLPEKSWVDIGQWEEYRLALKQLKID